jgi:hypothetical protein
MAKGGKSVGETEGFIIAGGPQFWRLIANPSSLGWPLPCKSIASPSTVARRVITQAEQSSSEACRHRLHPFATECILPERRSNGLATPARQRRTKGDV